ncbi:hypothetical protein ACJ73_06506 [Blastomyces percursus]|uniref:Uncharacterized protein n=1 Tax=Blastomyces percursus TaxID=1658174 RepID=A0A1J9R2B5_9EURO|nr:hypothetical protein ACJ73_06506 [Blastomyces percursus]
MQKALYDNRKLRNIQEIKSRQLYRGFSQTVRLTVVRRQQGQDEISTRFRTALANLRGRIGSDIERQHPRFKNALHIFTRSEHTTRKPLVESKQPVIRVIANTTGPAAAQKAEFDAADNPAGRSGSRSCSMAGGSGGSPGQPGHPSPRRQAGQGERRAAV